MNNTVLIMQKKASWFAVALSLSVVVYSNNTHADAASNKVAAQACQVIANGSAGTPYGDAQIDSFCQMATFDACIKEKTGLTDYELERKQVCQTLRGFAKSTGADPTLCGAC